MKIFAIKENMAGALALVCAAAVIFAIALDAEAGLGPANPVAAPGKAPGPDPGNVVP